MTRIALALIFSALLTTPCWALDVDRSGPRDPQIWDPQISRSSPTPGFDAPLLANVPDSRKVGLGEGGEGRMDRLLSEAAWGDPVASYHLGMLYYFGENFPQDYEEAAKLMRYAAERDVIDAQFILSSFYADGLGLARDYVQAYKWALISASRVTAGEKGEIAADLRDYLAEQMSLDEISEAEQLAQEWLAAAR